MDLKLPSYLKPLRKYCFCVFFCLKRNICYFGEWSNSILEKHEQKGVYVQAVNASYCIMDTGSHDPESYLCNQLLAAKLCLTDGWLDVADDPQHPGSCEAEWVWLLRVGSSPYGSNNSQQARLESEACHSHQLSSHCKFQFEFPLIWSLSRASRQIIDASMFSQSG